VATGLLQQLVIDDNSNDINNADIYIQSDGHTMVTLRENKGVAWRKRCTMPGARRRGRPRKALMDIIKTWTGLSVEESVRTTEDRDKWRKYVHGVANPRIEDG